jgi:DMSO reductase anchor subunit
MNHFSINWLSEDIKTAALFVIPCAAVALGVLVGSTLLRQASVLRETALVKAAMAERRGKTALVQRDTADKKKLMADPRVLWGVRAVILAVGILFVVLGILNGGMADVLGKAVRICTECIGLG